MENEIIAMDEVMDDVVAESKPGIGTGKAMLIGAGVTLAVTAGVKLAMKGIAAIKAKRDAKKSGDEDDYVEAEDVDK